MKKHLNLKAAKAAACTMAAVLAVSSVPIVPQYTAFAADSDSAYYLNGDVIGNNGVDTEDALHIQKHCADLAEIEGTAELAADANKNGEIEVADAVYILQWLVTFDRVSLVGEYIDLVNQDAVVHNAEDGVINGGAAENTNEGFLGDAYVNLDNVAGSSVSFNVNAYETGNYKLRIRYANGTENPRGVYITANDSNIATLAEFQSTGSWTEWTEAIVIVELEKGDNTLNFISATEEGAPNIDQFSIRRTCLFADETVELPSDIVSTTTIPDVTTTTTTVTTTVTEPPVVNPITDRYYAIEADMYDGWVESDNAGFAGEGYFNYNNAIGSYVEWTVEVPEAGNYQVDFRFANGTDADRITKITVNGAEECCYLSFLGTGAWTTWSTNSVVLELKAGTNTIKAYATTANGGPNMDYIELTKTDAPAADLVKPKDGRQVENLNRGVSAAYSGKGVLVSWRILATDDPSTTFDLWKNGETKLGTFTINDASNYFDASGTGTDWYTIDTFVNGEMTEFAQASRNLSTKSSGQSGAYFDIPLQKPAEQTMPDGTTCTYTANDATVGDVDGDGEYEIILKWDPSNSHDNADPGYTGTVFIDCYKLDGTRLWRIDLGKNIRAGAHYTQMMVFDYDGDGKAELVCKTADGTKDGQGTVIGDASADYRDGTLMKDRNGNMVPSGRVLSGPEYLTLFEGETGKALHTIDYKPGRGSVDAWGDNYGNRVDRFTALTAYLDGKTPSVIMCRGYYTRMTATAYNVVNNKLVEVWAFDTGNNSSAAGYHDGNHNAMPADVDLDGRDELVMGSAVIDDNGKLLYTSGLEHGDALHVSDFVPDNPGLEIFMCHEGAGYGISLRDGETGEIILREEASGDTGRAVAGNLIASNPGAEFNGSHSGNVYNSKKEVVCQWSDITKWGQNSVIYWSGTLERGVLDRLMVDQHGLGRIFTGEATYNNYSKSNVSLSADILGDWREEIIAPADDSAVLRVFGTTYTTEYPIFTLMHDTQYRTQVAGQNVGYNQPPHPSFYLGSDTGVLPAFPEVYAAE